tara:strand:+ start:42781 stop:43518 length:738 start_codon:yes stop_codon:yes gene_type:complete
MFFDKDDSVLARGAGVCAFLAFLSVPLCCKAQQELAIERQGSRTSNHSEFNPDFNNFSRAQATKSDASSDTIIPSEPGYLTPWMDPEFGGTYIRVTNNNDPGWVSKYAGHHYGEEDVFNADGSLIWLRLGGIMLDGDTYEVVDIPRIPDGLRQWHRSDPNLMMLEDEGALVWWHVIKGKVVQSWDFSDRYSFDGPDEQAFDSRRNGDTEGRFIAFSGRRKIDGEMVAMVLDLSDPNPKTAVVLEV